MLLLLLSLPLLAWAGPSTASATVNTPVLNMYSAASPDADVTSQAIYGTAVAVLDNREGWSRIRTPDEYVGWVQSSGLHPSKTGEPAYAAHGKVAQVQSLFSNLYREPDVTKHQPVLVLPFETKLEVVREQGGDQGRWLQVRLVDDRPAWIQRGDLTLDPAHNMSIPEMIQFSKKFLGLPYLWGGTSSFGYDCSGFTQMLCRRRGIGLPRDAGPQAHWSGVMPVDRSNLQPGDLLYFGKSEQKITHTGMYIGDGQFIHATTNTRPMVQISRLADAPWPELLVACRRVKQ